MMISHVRGETGVELRIKDRISLRSSVCSDRSLKLEEETEVFENSSPGRALAADKPRIIGIEFRVLRISVVVTVRL